ncbi:MAG TPA: RsiV family protein, partial [Bacteroidales bacterium]|nr:RsiV family protein [Bacteroidales bacterium]
LSDEGFFVEVVTATPNFMLSETGITFHYNIYEIASYADGSIDITVPYDAIRAIIPAGGVIERMMK